MNIECAAFSVPRIDSIVWMFDGKEIDAIHDQVNDNSTKNHTTHTHTRRSHSPEYLTPISLLSAARIVFYRFVQQSMATN